MAEKIITICRNCGAVHKAKIYFCDRCDSRAVKQVDIGPLFPELVERDVIAPLLDMPERDFGVFCSKCGAKFNAAVSRACTSCGEPWQGA